jgi:hypothetical protein
MDTNGVDNIANEVNTAYNDKNSLENTVKVIQETLGKQENTNY